MKKLAILLFLVLMSCVSTHNPAPTERDPQNEAPFAKEYITLYNELMPKISESSEWSKQSAGFYRLISAKKTNNEALTSAENEAFFASARNYLNLRKKLFAIVKKFQHLAYENSQTKVTLGQSTSHTAVQGVNYYILNPKDQSGRELLFGLRMSLTAALILYDNFLSGIKPHYDNQDSRTKLKFDTKQKGEFDNIVKSFFDTDQRELLARAMTIFSTDYNLKNQYQLPILPMEAYLDKQILNSSFYNFMLKEGAVSKVWKDKLSLRTRQTMDYLNFAGRATLFALSFTFGNIAGSVNTQLRKGDLKNLPDSDKIYIKSKLKPFDILLEKTPFKATDMFIPGYYGHVAVYLGTQQQLESEDLWKYLPPEMQAHIVKGESILEALRYDERKTGLDKLKGVQLNSLESFLNIDELLVIRSRLGLSREQKILYVKNAREQFGKHYDFNFDIQTKEKIVCSELVYTIYTDVQWPIEKSAGRFTISPDHIMTQAFPDKPFYPILMYDKNSVRKEGDLALELFRNIQNNYTNMVYKEESIHKRTQDPQEIIHLSSGIAALQQRINMIRSAKNSIDMEYFIYHTETDIPARVITQELIKKAKEKVRIRFLVDSSSTVLKLKDAYATVLRDHGIHVRYYNAEESPISNFMKANQRNHRKSLVVDGLEALTGGRNIGAEYFDLSDQYNFLDTDVYIKGSIAKTIQDSFEAYWYSPLSSEPKYLMARGLNGKNNPEYKKEISKAMKMITESKKDKDYWETLNSWGPMMLAKQFRTICNDSTFVSDLPSDNNDSRRVFNTIKNVVSTATSSLDIESPYFVITDVGTQLFNNLLNKPNFTLNIQTNSLHSTDASYTVAAFYPMVGKLTSRGVNVWIYKGEKPNYMGTPIFKTKKEIIWGIHSKRAIVDGQTTLIGTYNVDPRSTKLNNEMVYICHNNKELAANVLQEMYHRRAQSAKLGPDGLPIDKSNIFQGASTSKTTQYLLLKRLVEIPALRDLL